MSGVLASKSQDEQLVVFQLLNQTYAVEISKVQEIIRLEKITRLPNAADFIEGVINLRGKIVPIIDLCKRFGLYAEDYSPSQIVITEIGEHVVGMMVGQVQEVYRVPVSSIEPPPSMINGIDASYLRGIVLREDGLIILLNPDHVLFQHERDNLDQIDLSA